MTRAVRALRHLSLALPLLLGAVLSGCGQGGSARKPDLVIQASGSFEGTLEPCGCKDGLGGLARRLGLHDRYRAEHPDVPVLLLDAGRAFPMKTTESDVIVPATRQSLDMLGVSVVNVGEPDLESGLSPYQALVRDGKFHVVSANLVSIDGNRPIFPPYTVVQGKVNGAPAGPKVAVIGVSSYEAYKVMDGVGGNKIHWLEFQKSLVDVVPKARAEADLVVVLGSFGIGGGRLVTERFPEVDLVVACTKNDDQARHYDYGKTDLLMMGTRGKYDVRIDIAKDAKTGGWTMTPIITPLDQKVPENAEGLSFVAHVKTELEETARARAALMRKDPTQPDYLGSASCVNCHAAEHASWETTRHAHAWEPMVSTKNTINPLCLHCHTVGFMEPNGYVLASDNRKLQGVGCESCHGPGSEHVADPVNHKLDRGSEATCRQCHTPGQTPDFDFNTFWPKIRHGK
jgi:nitrate/TMAO reductase-like tetraheme cytochrome c subunit